MTEPVCGVGAVTRQQAIEAATRAITENAHQLFTDAEGGTGQRLDWHAAAAAATAAVLAVAGPRITAEGYDKAVRDKAGGNPATEIVTHAAAAISECGNLPGLDAEQCRMAAEAALGSVPRLAYLIADVARASEAAERDRLLEGLRRLRSEIRGGSLARVHGGYEEALDDVKAMLLGGAGSSQ